jgi:hypothetical protein
MKTMYGDDRKIRNVVDVDGELCLVARGCRPAGTFRKSITHNQICKMQTVNCSLKKIAYACDGLTDTSCKHEARTGRPSVGDAMLDKITVPSELKEALEAKAEELGISVTDARREAYRLFTNWRLRVETGYYFLKSRQYPNDMPLVAIRP